MKKTILLYILLFASVVSAQTTYDLDWAMGINGEAASLTIETGDTVRWTWVDGMPHDVKSLSSSQENFDSGIMTGVGTQFEYTFTQEGNNNYECTVHPNSMFGTITVVENLSTEDKFIKNLTFYPNPVVDKITISSAITIENIKIYNALGSVVLNKNINNTSCKLDLSQLQSGVYILIVKSDTYSKTSKLIKK